MNPSILKKSKIQPLSLKFPVLETFIPLAATFVTHAAKGLGLTSEAAGELGLAAEEVTAHLVRVCPPGQTVEIRCFPGSYFVETDFALPVRDLDLRIFNMTASICPDDMACLDQMGLLIASRMTDRFRLTRQGNGDLLLTLIKEREYPGLEPAGGTGTPKAMSHFTIEPPDPARIHWFLKRVHQFYPETAIPRDFRNPGKVVDMAAAEDYRILSAIGKDGETGGGIAWKREGQKTVEFFGPYIFHPESAPAMTEALLEACIAEVARTSVLVLLTRMPAPGLPQGYLEPLGAPGDAPSPEASSLTSAYFRMMTEDAGAVMWAHPGLLDFLRKEVDRLVFPREIQPVPPEGESREPHSVLSIDMDRTLGRAVLRPIWPGADASANLAGHLRLLQNEALKNVFFEMDLGLPWHAGFTPGLLELGFSPRMILPHAGTGDLVIFELEKPPV